MHAKLLFSTDADAGVKVTSTLSISTNDLFYVQEWIKEKTQGNLITCQMVGRAKMKNYSIQLIVVLDTRVELMNRLALVSPFVLTQCVVRTNFISFGRQYLDFTQVPLIKSVHQ